MSKNYYTDYTQDGYPIKELKSEYGNPPHLICDICNDDGKCLNNEKNPKYENDMFGNGDIYDCVNYLEKKNNTQGKFIRGYIKNIQEKKTEPKKGFNEWSLKH